MQVGINSLKVPADGAIRTDAHVLRRYDVTVGIDVCIIANPQFTMDKYPATVRNPHNSFTYK